MNHHLKKKKGRGVRGEEALHASQCGLKSIFEKKIALGIFVMVLALGGWYLNTINKTAVQGFAIRKAENRLAELREENNQLKIQEAELKSLYRIEETSRRLNMFEPQQVSYLEATGPLALK